jgi:hypothetical protein
MVRMNERTKERTKERSKSELTFEPKRRRNLPSTLRHPRPKRREGLERTNKQMKQKGK